MEWDASSFLSHLDAKGNGAQKEAEKRLMDAVDDLARIAQSIAPIHTGYLRKQIRKSMRSKTGALSGEVSFNAIANSSGYGEFNYAIWTHEFMGAGQARTSGGTDGYTVGPKYLTRPLEGEEQRWLREIASGVKGVLD
ncbi:hypothetical protein [Alteribacter populi]|uniref:hypothetical protein n=1 Tax=Alteribacter populi TaxID=2011011 RepID=UPI000BBB1619|nr:hypothetical protein [Alteribacter populi]